MSSYVGYHQRPAEAPTKSRLGRAACNASKRKNHPQLQQQQHQTRPSWQAATSHGFGRGRYNGGGGHGQAPAESQSAYQWKESSELSYPDYARGKTGWAGTRYVDVHYVNYESHKRYGGPLEVDIPSKCSRCDVENGSKQLISIDSPSKIDNANPKIPKTILRKCDKKCNWSVATPVEKLNTHKSSAGNQTKLPESTPSLPKVDSAINECSISDLKNKYANTNVDVPQNRTNVDLSQNAVVSRNLEKCFNEKNINNPQANTESECPNAPLERLSSNFLMQLKSLLIVLNEKLHDNFRVFLITQSDEPKSSDEAIFCFQKENQTTGKIECSLYDVKYLLSKENTYIPTTSERTLSSFYFNLERYYNIYLEYVKSSSYQRDNKTVNDFIIYSNLDLSNLVFDRNNINIVQGSRPNSYKLIVGEQNEIYNNLLKKNSKMPALAKLIADYIVNEESVILTGLMKKYHMALIQENVIVTKLKKDNGKKRYIGKFHRKFIEGYDLTEPAKELRYHLERYLCRSISETMELNLSINFGRDFILNKNPEVREIDKLATELTTVISSSITMPKEKILFRKTHALKDDIDKIVGHILKTGNNGAVIFTDSFLNDTNLPGNLNLFRNLIKEKLKIKNINFEQLKNCNFKINEFRDRESNIVVKKLPYEDCNKAVRDFFNKVEFVSNKTDFIDLIGNVLVKEFKLIKGILLEQVDILLHQSCVKLKKLMDADALITLIKTPKLLMQFLIDKISIGELIVPSGFDEDCCININVKQRVIIRHEIFEEKVDDIFIIAGIEKSDFRKYLPLDEKVYYLYELDSDMQIAARFILLGCTGLQTNFDTFIEKNEDSNVHLLKYESKNFIWQKSNGSISALLRYKVEDLNFLCASKPKQDVLTDNSVPKIMIISGESGAGKSTYMYNLAKRLQKISALPLWVVQINLSKSILNQYEDRVFESSTDAIYFLVELLDYDLLRKRMFFMSSCGMLKLKLALFFDGFDELRSKHANFVISLLKHIQDSCIEKIFVTVRPNRRSQLETELNVFSYRLESFSYDEKVEFLVKYWNKLGLSKDESILCTYAESLLRSFDNRTVDLTYTPLQLKMLAEIHKQKFHTTSNQYSIVHLHDEYDLYRRFDNLTKTSGDREILQRISLKRLLKTSDYNRLGFKDDSKNDMSLELEQHLNHITFAEYFAAQWLVDQRCSEILHYIIFECIDGIVNFTSPVFLISLVNLFHLNNQGNFYFIVNFLAKSGHVNFLRALLQLELHDYTDAGQSPLQMAAESSNIEVVKFLLEHYNDTGDCQIMEHGDFKQPEYANSKLVKFVNKIVQGKSAVQLAAQNQNVAIVCELMLMGADVSCLEKEFLQLTTLHVATEISKVDAYDKHRFYPIAEKLLKIAPQAVAHFNKENEFPRLLSYFFKNGRVEVINRLLDALDDETDKYKLLEASVGHKTPLNYINDSVSLNDKERLEITKYLIEKIGSELHKRNEHYLWPVLQAAVRSEHTRTFEYFIDQYPDSYTGFLRQCLQTNKLDAVEFLLRNNERISDSQTGNTALHTAVCLKASLKIIKYLIDKGGIDNTNGNGENPLCSAIKIGAELSLVKYLIERGASVNAEDKCGFFPWCYAILEDTSFYIKEEQLEIMRYFLRETKSGIVIPPVRNKSYLYDKWRDEVIRKLEFFRDPDMFDLNFEKKGDPPRLHSAIKTNNLNWCKFLIVHGADVNVTDSNGKTALHIAIEFSRYDIAKILLQNWAMFDVVDQSKKTPLDLLRCKGDQNGNREYEEMKELLKNATKLFSGKKFESLLKDLLPANKDKIDDSPMRYLVNCYDKRGRSMLHMAADTSSKTAIKDLIRFSINCSDRYRDFRRLDVNVRDLEGNTPIHLAARKGYETLIAELASEGACFEVKNVSGKTPRYLAAENHFDAIVYQLDTINELFQAIKTCNFTGAKSCVKRYHHIVNAKDNSGRGPLHFAVASSENVWMVKDLILEKNIVISITDFYMKTPLHYAVENDNFNCVKILLKAGAMIDARCRDGRRPFDFEEGHNRSVNMLKAIYKLFEDLQSDEPRIFWDDCSEAFIDYLMPIERLYCVDRDVIVNTRDSKRNTLMHYAVKYDYLRAAEVLLKNGAIYNARNNNREKPEDYAKNSKQLIEAVDKMFKKVDVESWIAGNVDPNIIIKCRGIGGYTLLHEAVRKGKIRETTWLVQRGANVNVSNNKGSSLLQHADKHYPEIAKLLRKM